MNFFNIKKCKTFFCFILSILLSIQIISPISILAADSDDGESVTERREDFLNFYSDSGSMVLDAKNLSSQDYYVLSAFMSNWYKPGVTTLSELTEDDSVFMTEFTSALSKSGNTSLISTIKTIAQDTIAGLNSGKCTLYESSGKLLQGEGFLVFIRDAMDPNEELQQFYYEKVSNSTLAFDLTEPTVRAAFQIVAAYNPKLFLDKNGIQSLDMFFLDAVGNIWGLKLDGDETIPTDAINYNNMVTSYGADHVYLVLPACLNPSAFTPQAKSTSDLRMPLVNRFTLGCLVDLSDFESQSGTSYSFLDDYIPFYNLLDPNSYGAGSKLKTNLAIFGVQSMSPYIKGLGEYSGSNDEDYSMSEDWNYARRKQDLAFLVYNPSYVAVNKERTNGIGQFGTQSYIVFAPNMSAAVSNSSTGVSISGNGTNNRSIDLNESFIIWANNSAFSVLNNWEIEPKLKAQQKIIQYLYTPIFLTLNQVSMNLYYQSGLTAVSDEESLSDKLAKGLYDYIDEQDVVASKMGLRGLSLFFSFEGTIEMLPDGDTYAGVAVDRIQPSKFMNRFFEEGSFDPSMYTQMKNGKISEITFSNGAVKTILSEILKAGENPGSSTFTESSWGLSSDTRYKKQTNADGDFQDYLYYINPHNFINLGSSSNGVDDITISPTSSLDNVTLNKNVAAAKDAIVDIKDGNAHNTNDSHNYIKFYNKDDFINFLVGVYGYSIFGPSEALSGVLSAGPDNTSYNIFGSSDTSFTPSITLTDFAASGDLMMGAYFGYILDMMGISTCEKVTDNSAGKLSFYEFNSPFLPKYSIAAKGEGMSFEGEDTQGTGVLNSSDLSFEQKQKDLIDRIYGLTTDSNNDYRNNLIKNILEGFILTVHRTITGTWYSNIDSVTTGSGTTYQSVTGYIYTPTLEELSFTAPLMNNYLQIYIFCMIIILFLMILMVLMHMRTWQQGVLITLFMSVGLLFPYILISNSVNISNAISDSVYSDRFDFWALIQQQQSLNALNSAKGMNTKDTLLTISSMADKAGIEGDSSVRIKWMAPKRVDMFQNLYSDADLSESFVTNMEIFKWLFSSTIYDSEFVDTETYDAYLYRPYNSIVSEARSYAGWVSAILNKSEYTGTTTYENLNGLSFSNIPNAYAETLNMRDSLLSEYSNDVYLASLIGYDKSYYSSDYTKLSYSDEKLSDLQAISGLAVEKNSDLVSKLGVMGSLNAQITERIYGDISTATTAGIVSNLPSIDTPEYFDNSDIKEISKAVFLKNTESPYYYFYTVLKARYAGIVNNTNVFKKALLENEMFKVSSDEVSLLNNQNTDLIDSYRDFLDLEGLFTYLIPYMNASNEYVINWREKNGDVIETYNFEYVVDENGVATVEDNTVSQEYRDAVEKKNNMNKVWNMYCPWVDSLYSLDVYNESVSVGGRKLVISDTLNPSSYIEAGRPMIFSEADMIAKGYTYKDLTDIERRIQAVTEKTYEDFLYLLNYYDLDDEVLIGAAAMYATFHFNQEFSHKSLLGESVMLYPQNFELKNFNYDAFMRLAMLNATGENIFGDTDLYESILAQTSIFTGLLLIVSDLIACILIPLFKFIILVGLLFLGVLICIACVVNPPEKIFEAINKSLLLPTVLFMALNIGFAWVMSFVVGEGLTSYVGSKGINFATNDPTITILIMSLLGVVYCFCAFKILKFLVSAYKKFGMSTALAAVGIVGAAVAAGTSGVAKKATKAVGSGVGAGIGAATSEKGHRLSGAFEGASAGAGGIMDRRIRERRMKELFGGTTPNKEITDKVDGLASSQGSNGSGSTGSTGGSGSTGGTGGGGVSNGSGDSSSKKVKPKKTESAGESIKEGLATKEYEQKKERRVLTSRQSSRARTRKTYMEMDTGAYAADARQKRRRTQSIDSLSSSGSARRRVERRKSMENSVSGRPINSGPEQRPLRKSSPNAGAESRPLRKSSPRGGSNRQS